MSQTTGFTQITQEGLLAVRGKDAKTFLQGQLTCNLNYVSNERSSLGARCTPKGRIQSTFRILPEADGYLLAMHRPLVERQLNELKKFAMFSKSTLIDESELWVRFGLINAQAALIELGVSLAKEANSVAQHNELIAVRVSENLCELWLKSQDAACYLKRLNGLLEELSLNAWQLELIRCGIGHVTESNFEEFIPQMLNLPALDAVSFKKGCYTGQEIVARMQYLGKLKRHMYRFSLDSKQLPEVGTALFSPLRNSALGEVISAAYSETGVELLAVALEEAVQESEIRLAQMDGELLTPLTLPYVLDSDKEITR
ncbi:MAG: folate-binding protein [Thiopseudomonas sp.]|nr:folate-binding protein [Thiopseudomonas sp.]MCK9465813.1 folate-binding protein [Thiopseudomonas sp.]